MIRPPWCQLLLNIGRWLRLDWDPKSGAAVAPEA